MTNDPVRVEFRMDPDPLLVGILSSAVQFQALQAGLGSEKCTDFARASEDVCRESLSQFIESGRTLDVSLVTFPDRIEISIHQHSQMAPAVGLESFAVSEASGQEGRLNGLELLSRVDRVLFSSEKDVARTTLVKFLPRK